MSNLRWWSRVLFRRGRWEQEMRDELEFHVRTRADDLIREGLPEKEALRQARLQFGAEERWKEQCRESSGTAYLDEALRNVRDAWRSVRRSPAFAVVAIVSLALGIGANLAVFALLKQLVLSPLPVREPQQLHQVVLSTTLGPLDRLSYPQFEALRDHFPLFESLFGWGSLDEWPIVAGDRRTQGYITTVTGGFFEGLGVQPALGRLITPADDRPGGGAHVAVLGYDLWQRLFAGDPAVIGRSIQIQRNLTVQVIGVTQPAFAGAEPGYPVDVYVPVHAQEQQIPMLIAGAGQLWMHVMARLKPEVPLQAAQNVLRTGWLHLDADRARQENRAPELPALVDGSRGYSRIRLEYSQPLAILMGLVAVVFLIACANLATLLFVRANHRSGELAIRVALGAGRGPIVRQWLTECALLAIAGGAAALVMSEWISAGLLQFVPESSRSLLTFRVTPSVLLLAALLSATASCLFGGIPTLRASGIDPQEVLRARGPSVAGRRSRAATMVLAGQLAASTVLAAGALLFARTLWNLNTRPIGFDRQRVVFMALDLSNGWDRLRPIVDGLQHSPMFSNVSTGPLLSSGPWGGGWASVTGAVPSRGGDNFVGLYWVSRRFFATLSIPFVAGRDFDEHDATMAAPPVIVSERLARHYFGSGPDAIGREINIAQVDHQIVGVVRDVIDGTLRDAPRELAYLPQSIYGSGYLLAQLAPGAEAAGAEAAARELVEAAAAKGAPRLGVIPLEDDIQKALSRDRLVAELSAALGLLGILLAAIGLFGAVAHWATGRTREIGIRMTLGASSWDVARLVLRQGLAVTALGVVLGVPLSIAGGKLIEPLLFGVEPTDVTTLAVTVGILAVAGLVAACWPAWRAARINALDAVRYE